MLFETRKISTETLGEYLAEVRKNMRLSLQQAAEQASIKTQFLQSLEEGNLAKLPADVYVVGFLKNIAAVYAIDPAVLIDQYRRERGIADQLLKKNAAAGNNRTALHKIIITPKVVSVWLGGAFVALTLFYVVWQVLSINKAPRLDILEPTDQQVISQSSTMIKGVTDAGSSLTINDQPVFVDDQGHFSTELGIEPGVQQLIFVSKNKFNKAVTKQISVTGEASSTVSQQNFILTLSFLDQATVTISTDDGPETTFDFHKGDTKTIAADNKIVVSTSNGGATQVALNKQSLGVMGRVGEVLTNVPFFPETDSGVLGTSTPGQ